MASMIPVYGSSFGRAGGRLRRNPAVPKTPASSLLSAVDPIAPSRFPPAQTLNPNRVSNLSIELHALHPPPLPLADKGHLLPQFHSGATGLPGRFSDGFLLRRLHIEWMQLGEFSQLLAVIAGTGHRASRALPSDSSIDRAARTKMVR